MADNKRPPQISDGVYSDEEWIAALATFESARDARTARESFADIESNWRACSTAARDLAFELSVAAEFSDRDRVLPIRSQFVKAFSRVFTVSERPRRVKLRLPSNPMVGGSGDSIESVFLRTRLKIDAFDPLTADAATVHRLGVILCLMVWALRRQVAYHSDLQSPVAQKSQGPTIIPGSDAKKPELKWLVEWAAARSIAPRELAGRLVAWGVDPDDKAPESRDYELANGFVYWQKGWTSLDPKLRTALDLRPMIARASNATDTWETRLKPHFAKTRQRRRKRG